MPVIVAACSKRITGAAATAGRADIDIGVLNNLSDAGLKGGEQQWIDLFERAAGERTVRLRFFTLPQIARGARARARLDGFYGDIADLKRASLDGLIVTGCEPRAADLRREDFWSALTEIVDWARDHTRSTIWSCLAAHAAVLHLDGIARRRLPEKCSGVFQIERVGVHALTAEIADHACVPHSRYNDLDERELVDHGYEILTRSRTAGVDAFVKSCGSLFVFLQGHPEYDRHALGREYRRDVTRFLDGVTTTLPRLPRNYFSPQAEVALQDLAGQSGHDRALLAGTPELRAWEDGLATSLIGGWLRHLAEAAVCVA